jgi:hypothetical protein
MSIPFKDNKHILSNQQAFQEAYARARESFGQIDGVVGVGFGQKKTKGEYKDDIAIVVFVREKKREEDLPPEQRISPSFEGYRTDVRVVDQATAETCDNTAHYDRIQGGIQIAVRKAANSLGVGTLGCIVKKRNDGGRENVYLLTNKHVLFGAGAGARKYVYHPTPSDDTLGSIQDVAFYNNFPYPSVDLTSPGFFIDCAIARIDIDSTCFGSTCTKDAIKYEETLIADLQVNGVNSISDVRSVINDSNIIGRKVFKVGRTTGKTTGIVRLIGASFNADPEPEHPAGPSIAATNTIEITFDVTSTPNGLNCKGNPRFTEGGDSGSIVVDENNRVIGIHTHGRPPGPGVTPSNACHILPVLDYLGVCIPTTNGTSHGSSRATDGSGVGPAILGDFPIPDGQIVFTAQQVKGELPLSSGLFEPVPASDDEVLHMRKLLEDFRSTSKGRKLHTDFAEVRREIGYLVRNCRPVKVAWHRNKGPAFLTHALNHLKGYSEHVPNEVDGVSLGTLLTRMSEVLSKYGSHPLRRAIEQNGDDLLSMLTEGSCNCVQDCIAYLQEKESQ